jgi:DNA-binding transcriptional LysR family regulator
VDLRGINTNLVVALRALLVRRNVTRAAKDVGLTQSSMSHALGQLRAHFDDALLVPAGRELVLTERAKSLVEPVVDAVERLERVFARAEPFDPRSSRRTFRIASSDNMELYVLPRLAAVLKDAPGIDVRVRALPEDWEKSLQRGEIDLKLGRKYPIGHGLTSQTLSKERFACVVRRGHPAPSKPTLRDYADLDHLVISPMGDSEGSTSATRTRTPASPLGHVDAVLERHGLRRRVVLTVPHFLVAPFVVAQSDLVLTVPVRLLDHVAKPLRLRHIELPVRLAGYELSQVWATRSDDDEAHRWLRGAIAEVLAPPPE